MNKDTRKYLVEYLPIAQKDLIEISSYIMSELNSLHLAESMLDNIISNIEKLSTYPFRNPLYKSKYKQQNEYRKCYVKKYIAIYTIDEEFGIVTIYRVLYNKRDFTKINI